MKFNLTFILKGPGGEVEAPNQKNPVEETCLREMLLKLANNLPFGNSQLGIEVVGVRVEPALDIQQALKEMELHQPMKRRMPNAIIQGTGAGQTQPPPYPPKWTSPMCSGLGDVGTGPGET